MVIRHYAALSAALAAVSALAVAAASCGPGDGCEITKTCPKSSAEGGAGGSDGGSGGSGQGAGGTGPGGGGMAPTCGNATVDPGEVCFTEPAVDYPTQGEQGADLLLLDCDGDDDLDAVLTNMVGPSLVALRNDGQGIFAEAVSSVGSFDQHVDLAAADLGAGAFEIAGLSSISGRVEWYSGDPSIPCGFEGTSFSSASVGSVAGLTYADVDGNGNLDTAKLIGTDPTSEIWVHRDHLLTGDPVWSVAGTAPRAIVAADFIAGGGDDLIIAASDLGSLKLYENLGDNTFEAFPFDVPPGGTGDQPVAMAVGDIDASGTPDVVSANRGSGTIAVLRNLGGGSFAAQTPEPTVGANASSPVAIGLADVDMDGDLDVVTANDNDGARPGSLSIFLNNGAGKLTLAEDVTLTVTRNPVAIGIGDLNGDGALDLVTISSYTRGGDSTISVLLANP